MDIDEAALTHPEREVYDAASALLKLGVDAVAFSERVFGPDGEVRRLATSAAERERLIATPLYGWLKAQFARLRQDDAARFERDLKASPGRLTVAVPRSLHAALKDEAAAEGVSLSELIRLKLSVPYHRMTALLVNRS